MLAAAGNETQGRDMVRHFILHQGIDLPVTEEVYETARQNNGCGEDILRLLERRRLGDYSG